jgi:hypothetical protein
MHNVFRVYPVVAAFALTSASTLVVDPPDLRINTISGRIATVGATWSGSN